MSEPVQCPACKGWFRNDPHFCAPFPLPSTTESLKLSDPEPGCRWGVIQRQDGMYLEYISRPQ